MIVSHKHLISKYCKYPYTRGVYSDRSTESLADVILLMYSSHRDRFHQLVFSTAKGPKGHSRYTGYIGYGDIVIKS